eukprot:scaffold763_cov402-Prasinococcus_capsulatus_cf.AAC.7
MRSSGLPRPAIKWTRRHCVTGTSNVAATTSRRAAPVSAMVAAGLLRETATAPRRRLTTWDEVGLAGLSERLRHRAGRANAGRPIGDAHAAFPAVGLRRAPGRRRSRPLRPSPCTRRPLTPRWPSASACGSSQPPWARAFVGSRSTWAVRLGRSAPPPPPPCNPRRGPAAAAARGAGGGGWVVRSPVQPTCCTCMCVLRQERRNKSFIQMMMN